MLYLSIGLLPCYGAPTEVLQLECRCRCHMYTCTLANANDDYLGNPCAYAGALAHGWFSGDAIWTVTVEVSNG
ncbi:hypothetical protein EDC04DRAFT_2737070 [Pisolithus marmoratus]|nr:hypothetical protein EDC04DRAFT_2785013 [Pisolithus marmoratus]KAI6020585.1 hypothetical protein EDC04DRAFT_2737070 [Pisolithus marmoratus]